MLALLDELPFGTLKVPKCTGEGCFEGQPSKQKISTVLHIGSFWYFWLLITIPARKTVKCMCHVCREACFEQTNRAPEQKDHQGVCVLLLHEKKGRPTS